MYIYQKKFMSSRELKIYWRPSMLELMKFYFPYRYPMYSSAWPIGPNSSFRVPLFFLKESSNSHEPPQIYGTGLTNLVMKKRRRYKKYSLIQIFIMGNIWYWHHTFYISSCAILFYRWHAQKILDLYNRKLVFT